MSHTGVYKHTLLFPYSKCTIFGEPNGETPQNCCENEENPRVFTLRQTDVHADKRGTVAPACRSVDRLKKLQDLLEGGEYIEP